jgi:hypothetical protein
MRHLLRQAAQAATIIGLVAACDSNPVEPGTDAAATLTVDARTDWAFVELGATASERTIANPTASTEWDIAFNATRVMLNGGAAGPADVEGYCLCDNADATDVAIQAMTPESELAAFEAITLADLPTDEAAWQSDALDPAIDGWYSYDVTTHTVSAAPDQVFKLRGAGADPVYVKLHVTDIAQATQAGAVVTIEYAVQADSGAAMGAVQTVELDGRAGPVYYDFATGASSAQQWDILLDGFDIRVNGGVSGSGGAAAVVASESFEAMTDASDAPARIYRGDAYGGVFDAHPWYRYNLDGNHTIFPTYDVYLIRSGGAVYKVQIISYYNTAGDARHITFRYAPLD